MTETKPRGVSRMRATMSTPGVTVDPAGMSKEPPPQVSVATPDSDRESNARARLSPFAQAANDIYQWDGGRMSESEVLALAEELSVQCRQVIGGNMNRAETMLISQAHVLNSIFSECVRKAGSNFKRGQEQCTYSDSAERFLRLGLRAQGQCRATLETLAVLKNPPAVAFVRQANIATAGGNQQINNGTDLARPRETTKQPNKLLELTSGKRLDNRASQVTSDADPALASLESIERPQVLPRKKGRVAKRV